MSLSLRLIVYSYCEECLKQVLSTCYVVQAYLGKFGLHVGNVKFSTQNERVNMWHTFSLVFHSLLGGELLWCCLSGFPFLSWTACYL